MTIRIVLREKEIVMDRAIFMEILAGRGKDACVEIQRAIRKDEDGKYAKIDRNVDCEHCLDCLCCEYCDNCDNCINCKSCDSCDRCTNCTACYDCLNCTGLSGCLGWINNEPRD
jgi:hypothetical protein